MCNAHKKKIKEIIKKAQDLLLNDITKLEKYNVDNNSFKKLFIDDNFGSLIKDEKDLTFIDIIKGIFPLKLSDYLSKTVKMSLTDRITVSVSFLNYIYDETKLIWNERCDLQIRKEKRLRIKN